jgi:hypothetical protein
MDTMDSIKLSNKAYVLVRDITQVECTWLKRDFKINEVVYLYDGHTYNCISRNGKAYTEMEDTNSFFELPNDATRLLE